MSKEGVNGRFVVEVTSDPEGASRVLARRFITEAEAQDFFTRTQAAHQHKANREGRSYGIFLYETATPRDPVPKRGIGRGWIIPLR